LPDDLKPCYDGDNYLLFWIYIMEQTTFLENTKKSRLQNATNWQIGEVDPLDLGKPYQPIAKPLSISTDLIAKKELEPLKNQIYRGDSISIMSIWPNGYFDACITDPPYNIAQNRKGLKWSFSSHVTISDDWDRFSKNDYKIFTANWLKEICRITKTNGNIFIFGSYHNIFTIGSIAEQMDLRVINSIIWIKPNAQPNITCRMFTESTEQILWLCNNSNKHAKKWTFNYHHMKELNRNKQMRNFWEIPLTPMRERIHGKHPSQKPIRLMERIILAGTNPKDAIIDCFSGSGSTLLAADRLERNWVGIEQDQTYCQIAYKRLDEERKQRRLFR